MNKLKKLLIIPIIFASLISCSKKEKSAAGPHQAPVPVVVGKAIQKDVPVLVTAVGTVESVTSVTVKPQVGGVLLSTHFQEGQDIQKGQLLFTVDPRSFQAALAQAEANLAKDIAQANNAKQLVTRYENLVKKD